MTECVFVCMRSDSPTNAASHATAAAPSLSASSPRAATSDAHRAKTDSLLSPSRKQQEFEHSKVRSPVSAPAVSLTPPTQTHAERRMPAAATRKIKTKTKTSRKGAKISSRKAALISSNNSSGGGGGAAGDGSRRVESDAVDDGRDPGWAQEPDLECELHRETQRDRERTRIFFFGFKKVVFVHCVPGNVCHRAYFDWDVSLGDWALIDVAMQPLNLCESCYLQALSHVLQINVSDVRVRAVQCNATQNNSSSSFSSFSSSSFAFSHWAFFCFL